MDPMKMSKLLRALLVGMVILAGFSIPSLRAEAPKPAESDMEAKLEALQGQIEALKAEVAETKRQMAEAKAAETAAPATEAAPAAAAAPAAPTENGKSFLGSTKLTGHVDGFYNYNFNHPHSRVSDFRAFDSAANQFSLNLIKLQFEKTPDVSNSRLGYRLSFGYGDAMNVVNGTDPAGLGFSQYLYEAYFSYLAPVGPNGLMVDFGKFVTPHGAEVIDSHQNWNYSRGILFTYAIPFYHFGLRSTYAFNDKLSMTGFLVNGWNSVVDNNTGKTVGVSFGIKPLSKVSLSTSYMAGPEQEDMNRGWRQLSDSLLTINATDKLTFMFNYDYGTERFADLNAVTKWQGVASYVRYAFNDDYAVAARYEWYNDPEGFTTGLRQQLKGITGTFERRIAKKLVTRLEFRHDYSNEPVFTRGDQPHNKQTTVAAGLMYAFDMGE